MTTFLTAAAARRWDIYGPVHKGLRLGHMDLMVRLGRAGFDGPEAELLADLAAHLAHARLHIAHEESVIHPALEARAAGACAALEAQHQHHRDTVAALAAAIEAVQAAGPQERPALGRALYLAFSAFVAEDLEHMRQEETATWPLLCAHFTDEELAGLEMSIISTLTPEENIAFMRLMLPAMSAAERAGLLGGMKAGAPPEAYGAVIELAARATLSAGDMAELERLGLAA